MVRFGSYMQYGPVICIGVVLAVLFVLWAFWGGRNYDFVGLAPLSPDTCGSYTGSLYDWGNVTPATGYDPIEGQSCVPPDGACLHESETESTPEISPPSTIIVDNTPIVPSQFLEPEKPVETSICPQESVRNITTSQPRNRRRFVSRGERLCCQTMERIYGVPFVTVRPSWLKNYTGMPLELDCYNADLQLAVEYNGEQHYKWPNFTNQTYQQFLDQINRDALKMELCDRNGIYLIVVPYNIPHDNIPSYIISHLPETIRKRLQEERTLANLEMVQ